MEMKNGSVVFLWCAACVQMISVFSQSVSYLYHLLSVRANEKVLIKAPKNLKNNRIC